MCRNDGETALSIAANNLLVNIVDLFRDNEKELAATFKEYPKLEYRDYMGPVVYKQF